MSINQQTGLLEGVRSLPSPNFNDRPDPSDISLLVIHGISLPAGEFGGSFIDDLFLNRLDQSAHPSFAELANLTVSSHLLINRQGQITQYVPFHLRAWHAGVSEFVGRANCNDYSIGIGLEGTDETAYTKAQYQVLSRVTKVLCSTYNDISPERIVGHQDIAPGRKTDPGPAFDWEKYRAMAFLQKDKQ